MLGAQDEAEGVEAVGTSRASPAGPVGRALPRRAPRRGGGKHAAGLETVGAAVAVDAIAVALLAVALAVTFLDVLFLDVLGAARPGGASRRSTTVLAVEAVDVLSVHHRACTIGP